MDQIDAVVPHLGEIKLPVLIIHGSEDTLVPIEASNIANSGITSSDKTYEVCHYALFKKGVLRTLIGVIFKQATEHPLGCSAVAFGLWDLNQMFTIIPNTASKF